MENKAKQNTSPFTRVGLESWGRQEGKREEKWESQLT
jgi:hypothetical protein